MINIETLKTKVIQYAISGKISFECNCQDSREYLKSKKVKFYETGPFDLPSHWAWTKCDDICDLLGGFAFKSENYTESLDGVRVIRISDFNNNGLINTEIKKYPYDISLDSYEIFENDILMCMTGGTVGKSCIFPKTQYRCFLNQRVALFRSTLIDIKFLYYVIKSSHIITVINDTKRSTNDNISMKIIGDFDVPFPPIEEQKKIVAKLDEIFAELDKIDEKQTKLLSIQDKTESKILKLAIQGKLVEQRPEEGTAEELFESFNLDITNDISFNNIPFEIPSSWKWIRLGWVMDIERGGSPRPIKAFITNSNDGINWIKIGDVDKGGKYIYSTKQKIKPEGESKSRRVYPGDFLLTNSMSFGHPYISQITGCIHDGWLLLRNRNNAFNLDYLYLILSSDYAYEQFSQKASGATVDNLNKDKVYMSLIPLPPFEEQKRIVAKIEELLPLCRIIKNE